MFLHIGGEYTVSDRLIIGIFDMDATTIAHSDTIAFLRKAEEDGLIENVSPDIPRAFVVTDERVYLTPISAATLKQRLNRPQRIDQEGDTG